MKKIFLVIPTIRDVTFLTAWQDQLLGVEIVVVEDNSKKTVAIPPGVGKKVWHFCHGDIRSEFGENEWLVGRKNSSIRNFGFWMAYQMGAEVIVTIDDDCYPNGDRVIEGHLANLAFKAHAEPWLTTYPNPQWMYTRGFPYKERVKEPVWVSHGLWSGALDLDGETEVRNGKLLEEKAYPSLRTVLPVGVYYPMCSMNLAFTREATPLMFFPMMGENPAGESWGYDRFDDIWAGILSKKVLDHLGRRVVSGSPMIEHRKKSIPTHNLAKEKAAKEVNEEFWRWVDVVELTSSTPAGSYRELAEKIAFPNTHYFGKLREAMVLWADLFD